MRYISNNSIANIKELLTDTQLRVEQCYPVAVSSYYHQLALQSPAIRKQIMPDTLELQDVGQHTDPLHEESLSPVPGLIHRYPDRVVLLVSDRCPAYCRFCMRKRLVGGNHSMHTGFQLDAALEYIRQHPEVTDVVLSGGDPLMLDDGSLFDVLSGLRAIKHVSIIRIGTRMPVTLPERITSELCNLLKQFHPLYINTHFNHPDEITEASRAACTMLADSGIPLGNQTVLLKGVNDTLEVMKNLLTGLLAIRVKPYYLHQMDLVKGTAHFRTSVKTGLELIQGLRGHISGLAIPHYVIDLPGGKGKVALTPDDVTINGSILTIRTYSGETVTYHDL